MASGCFGLLNLSLAVCKELVVDCSVQNIKCRRGVPPDYLCSSDPVFISASSSWLGGGRVFLACEGEACEAYLLTSSVSSHPVLLQLWRIGVLLIDCVLYRGTGG